MNFTTAFAHRDGRDNVLQEFELDIHSEISRKGDGFRGVVELVDLHQSLGSVAATGHSERVTLKQE